MTSKIVKTSLAAILLFFAGLLVAPSVMAADEPDHAIHDLTLQPQRLSLISPILTEELPFNAVAVQLSEAVEDLEVNFRPYGGGAWEEVEIHDDGFGPEALLFSSPTRSVQFRRTPSLVSHQPLSIKVTVFYQKDDGLVLGQTDGIGGPDTANLYAGELVAASSFRVIPRKEWGADETLRYWDPGSNRGAGSGADPCEDVSKLAEEGIGISHTTKNSPTGELLTWSLQYMKSVRKITIHHTDSELKDLNGDHRLDTRDFKEIMRAIYRFHTVSRGWGDIGYNYVIDPLGNVYEGRYGGDNVIAAHSLCHNNGAIGIAIIGNYERNEVPEPAMQAVISLSALVAKKYNIDPTDHGSFHGKTLPNIIGHRDVRATSCPGKQLYSELPNIRDRVALALRSGVFKEGSLQVENLDYNAQLVGGLPSISLDPNQRKKITLLFKNTGQKAWDNNTWLHVALNNNPSARVVPLIEDKSFVAADLSNRTVAPGQTGAFEVEVEGGYTPGNYRFEVSPVINGRYKVSRSSEYLAFSVREPNFSYEVVSKDLPSGTVFQGQRILASIDLKNTGNVVWKNYGSQQVTLGTSGPRDHKSVFIKQNPSRLGYLLDSEVNPGETGRFVMELEVPTGKLGEIVEQFTPVIENVAWLQDRALGFRVSVKVPNHLARVKKVNSVSSLTPGEMKRVELEMENRGDLPWDAESVQISLLGYGITTFKSQLVPEEPIEPGETGKFSFWIQAPYEKGRHTVFLRSRFDKLPIRNGSIRYVIDVEDPVLTAKQVEGGERDIVLKPNETAKVTVSFRNTGNVTWRKDGPNAVHLGTSGPSDRESDLANESWHNKFRPAEMNEDEVAPGEIATFTFLAQTPRRGIYNEDYKLVAENLGWIEGGEVNRVFRVFGTPVEAKPLVTKTETDAQKNQENAALITESRTISEQAKKNAEKVLANPVNRATGTTKSLPVQNVTTTTDALAADILASQQQAEKPFRVRISYGSENATLTANGAFVVTDGKGAQLFSLHPDKEVQVRRVGSSIHVQVGTVVKNASVIRFIPENDRIMEITSMERRPSWNTSLNDNRFRGTMEVRIVNNEVAYINELPLEDYLKGIGEVSNGDPLEKQKTIAVLARTYARFYMGDEHRKFPGLPYDGSDDPAVFQKYLGYGLETRSPNFTAAVKSTEDQVVTYKGKLVKTPYFNQSDGKTRSAEEVWGWKDTPYLLSVADPWSQGLSRNGHGVGLSGYGATAQAKEGKNYDEIIRYYYKDVKIESLDFD